MEKRKNSTRKRKIPKEFQPILWSANVADLDLEKDKEYIIHQILMYGSFKEMRWLFKFYGKDTVKQVFLKNPQNIYTSPAFNFLKNFILGFKKIKLNEKRYVKTLF